jgi:hypothetical protein
VGITTISASWRSASFLPLASDASCTEVAVAAERHVFAEVELA